MHKFFTEEIRSLMGLKKICPLFFTLVFATLAFGQRHEVGVQAGMSNLVGDIGRTNYILQKPFSDVSDFGLPFYAGIIYRRNFNPYQTVRMDVGYSNIQFNDKSSDEDYRKSRGIWGRNSVYHLDAEFEYNFFPINNELRNSMLSPYIFGGIGGIMYSNYLYQLNFNNYFIEDTAGHLMYTPDFPEDYEGRVSETFHNKFQLSIPFGAGLKYKLSSNWVVFGELKFRYTFTDNLDYSNPDAQDVLISGMVTTVDNGQRRLSQSEKDAIRNPFIKSKSAGNPQSRDWVNSITLGLSYSFGRPPCYCDR